LSNTSYSDLSKVFHQRFSSQIFTDSSVGKDYPNAPFDSKNPPKFWVRFTIVWQPSFHAGLGGGPMIKMLGLIVFDIYTPGRIGTGDLNTIVDDLTNFWAVKEFDCIRTDPEQRKVLGELQGSYREQLIIPWEIFRF